MSQQIRFFRKNKIDFTNDIMVVTASQGDDFTTLALNRSNESAWMTTGSVDADLTTFEIDLIDEKRFDTILLSKHNFKSYKIEYWNGLSFSPFSPAIDETVFAVNDSLHEFASQVTTRIRLTIRETQTVDVDKQLFQFIATEAIGQLNGWPLIQKPRVSRNRKVTTLLSGKVSVKENEGSFECRLKVDNWNDEEDLDIIESLYDSNDGFITWLSGGDEDQFAQKRQGYRLEDLFLMKCTNEYPPEWKRGVYVAGIKINIDLKEIAD